MVSDIVRKYREREKLSQDQLATKANVSRRTIAKIENAEYVSDKKLNSVLKYAGYEVVREPEVRKLR